MRRRLPRPGRKFFVLAAVVVTVSAAGIAALETDANIRADRANRRSQALALDIANILVKSNVTSTFELDLARESGEQGVRSAALGIAALNATDPATAAELQRQSDIAAAASEALKSASALYADPRYAPKEAGGLPDAEKYLADSTNEVQTLAAAQRAATDENGHWGEIANGYVIALTVLSVSLFILGLAQALPAEGQLPVGLVGIGISLLGFGWAFTQLADGL